MSITLHLELAQPVLVKALLPEVSQLLAEILRSSYEPDLILEVLEDGQRTPVTEDELRGSSSPLFLISIAGEPETVSLDAGEKYATIDMGVARTALEYVLGAAVAIALARRVGGVIGDDWHFFGDEGRFLPEMLLDRLKVAHQGLALREAADSLSDVLGLEVDADGADSAS